MEASPFDDWLRKALKRPRNVVAIASCITFLFFLFDGSNYGQGYTTTLMAKFYEDFLQRNSLCLKAIKKLDEALFHDDTDASYARFNVAVKQKEQYCMHGNP
jgi:hypothetical protein